MSAEEYLRILMELNKIEGPCAKAKFLEDNIPSIDSSGSQYCDELMELHNKFRRECDKKLLK